MSYTSLISRFAPVLAFSCALSIGGFAQTAGSTSTSDSASATHTKTADQTFMKDAAQGGVAEVELGQLAQQKAQSQEVKDFGQRMVTDHTKANDQLKQVASQEGVTLPTEPNAKQKAEKARLEKMSGNQFDKAYMNMMLTDHKKDIAEFKREAAHGQNPQVKEFAHSTLPTLEAHLSEAEKIAPKEKASSGKTSTTATNSTPQ